MRDDHSAGRSVHVEAAGTLRLIVQNAVFSQNMLGFVCRRNVSQESEKMTESQFVRNHRGIDQGQDPPKELLEGMYRRIKVRADQHTHSHRGLMWYLTPVFPSM